MVKRRESHPQPLSGPSWIRTKITRFQAGNSEASPKFSLDVLSGGKHPSLGKIAQSRALLRQFDLPLSRRLLVPRLADAIEALLGGLVAKLSSPLDVLALDGSATGAGVIRTQVVVFGMLLFGVGTPLLLRNDGGWIRATVLKGYEPCELLLLYPASCFLVVWRLSKGDVSGG